MGYLETKDTCGGAVKTDKCATDVILCIPPVMSGEEPVGFIDAELISCQQSKKCCSDWEYIIRYDDSQLSSYISDINQAAEALKPHHILGILYSGSFLRWVQSYAELLLEEEE